MKDTGAFEQQIRTLEERLLTPSARASREELDVLFTDDFVEFGSSGRTYTKRDVIDFLERESGEHFSLSNYRATLLAPGVVLATYHAVRHAQTSHEAMHSLRSSIWRFEGGAWRMVFHQGTPTSGSVS